MILIDAKQNWVWELNICVLSLFQSDLRNRTSLPFHIGLQTFYSDMQGDLVVPTICPNCQDPTSKFCYGWPVISNPESTTCTCLSFSACGWKLFYFITSIDVSLGTRASHIATVISSSKSWKSYIKAKCRTPAYSWALGQVRGVGMRCPMKRQVKLLLFKWLYVILQPSCFVEHHTCEDKECHISLKLRSLFSISEHPPHCTRFLQSICHHLPQCLAVSLRATSYATLTMLLLIY